MPANSDQRKILTGSIKELLDRQAAESEWFRAETADDPQWQALLADPQFQALENERAAIIADFGQKLARFHDRFREDLTPEEGAEADQLHAERQARLSELGDRYRHVAGNHRLPKPQPPGPTAFEITQGIQDEFSLELPELAEQLALLAVDIGSGTTVSQPIRQNAKQLANAVRLQYRAVAMEPKKTAPGKFQWIKKRGERTLDDLRLEHYLERSLAVLSDIQDGRKPDDASNKLRAIGEQMKGITAKAPAITKNANRKSPRRGRPSDTDPKADKQMFDAWQTGEYKTYEELARTLKMETRKVKLAIDRQRKRRVLPE
jgi:hypothetical protein